MTCKQLGGACDIEFEAATFEEIAALSKAHGGEMFQQKEPAHMEAMSKMMELMKSPGAMEKWMAEKREMFEALSDNA